MEPFYEKKEDKEIEIRDIKEELKKELGLEKREKKISLEQEKIIRERLEREIRTTKVSSRLQDDIQKQAQQIRKLKAKGKIKKLLSLVQAKSLVFAVATAKAMNDPYVLDVFHDLLIESKLCEKLYPVK